MNRNLRNIRIGSSLRCVLPGVGPRGITRADGFHIIIFQSVCDVSRLPGQNSVPWLLWIRLPGQVLTLSPRTSHPVRVRKGLTPRTLSRLRINNPSSAHTLPLHPWSVLFSWRWISTGLWLLQWLGPGSMSDVLWTKSSTRHPSALSSPAGSISTGNPVQHLECERSLTSSLFSQWRSTDAWFPSTHDYAYPLPYLASHGASTWRPRHGHCPVWQGYAVYTEPGKLLLYQIGSD